MWKQTDIKSKQCTLFTQLLQFLGGTYDENTAAIEHEVGLPQADSGPYTEEVHGELKAGLAQGRQRLIQKKHMESLKAGLPQAGQWALYRKKHMEKAGLPQADSGPYTEEAHGELKADFTGGQWPYTEEAHGELKAGLPQADSGPYTEEAHGELKAGLPQADSGPYTEEAHGELKAGLPQADSGPYTEEAHGELKAGLPQADSGPYTEEAHGELKAGLPQADSGPYTEEAHGELKAGLPQADVVLIQKKHMEKAGLAQADSGPYTEEAHGELKAGLPQADSGPYTEEAHGELSRLERKEAINLEREDKIREKKAIRAAELKKQADYELIPDTNDLDDTGISMMTEDLDSEVIPDTQQCIQRHHSQPRKCIFHQLGTYRMKLFQIKDAPDQLRFQDVDEMFVMEMKNDKKEFSSPQPMALLLINPPKLRCSARKFNQCQ
ncbi:Hypothetical predicted protein [Mytilus galloprovincialis]|uniref:Uncharacterized protein n=1 Tax=Mytilus galloprovincialis TaxID=29158 RepID=A0A8B6DR88_MYTGA|nr:Hypothetical predicted protein [Mytilus galloprovincialis]